MVRIKGLIYWSGIFDCCVGVLRNRLDLDYGQLTKRSARRKSRLASGLSGEDSWQRWILTKKELPFRKARDLVGLAAAASSPAVMRVKQRMLQNNGRIISGCRALGQDVLANFPLQPAPNALACLGIFL